MGKTVEDYVLSMQFDNRDFEKNVDKTTRSLANLKNSLKMDGTSKGLGEVSNSMKDLELASYKAGFQWSDVKGKIASSVEWRIAGKAIDAVTHGLGNLALMLTGLSNIKSGFNEYETQLGAIQTILANTKSKGSTLDDVNTALDELNAYADKTIYNFTEMTKNIGTFTAAGVDLDTSVNAIQGIANLAAVSGSTSQQASTAMYQLSQALASGTVKLMDWNSVVNAGMGGEVFQNALKETARLHGVAIDQIIEKQGSFRESLSEGWLTTNILTETLKKFTYSAKEGTDEWTALMESLQAEGYTEQQAKEIIELGNTATDAATKVKTFSQLLETLKESVGSGWAQSWEIIIGDFEEAKEMWSGLSDFLSGIINESSNIRNRMLTGVFDSGWSQLLSDGNLKNEQGFINWIRTVSKGAEDGGNAFKSLVEQYGSVEKALPHALKNGKLTSADVFESVDEYVKQLDSLNDAEKLNLGYTKEQVEQLKAFRDELQNGEGVLDKYVTKLSRMSGRDLLLGKEVKDPAGNVIREQTGAIANLYSFLKSMIQPIRDAYNSIFKEFKYDKDGNLIIDEYIEKVYGLLEAFQKFTASLKLSEETAADIKSTFRGLFAAIDIIFIVLKPVGVLIKKAFQALGPILRILFKITAAIGETIVKIRDALKSSQPLIKLATVLGDILIVVAKGLEQLFIQMGQLNFDYVVKGFQWMWNIISKIWNSLKYVFDQLYEYIYQNNNDGEKFTLQNILDGLLGILKILVGGFIGYKIGGFMGGLRTMADDFIDFIRDFKAELFGEMSDFEKNMIAIEKFKAVTIAIGVLVGALLVLTMIPKEKLYTAVATLTLIISMLMAALSPKKLKGLDGVGVLSTTLALIPLAIAIAILGAAIVKMSKVGWENMWPALIAMVSCLTALVGALWVIKLAGVEDPKKLKKTVNSLIRISIALLAMAAVLKLLATIPWHVLKRSLMAMSLMLFELLLSIGLLSLVNTNNVVTNVRKMIAIAGSLLILSITLKILNTMPWDDTLVAIGMMSLTLTVLIASLAVISKIKFTETASALSRLIGLVGVLVLVTGLLAVLTLMPLSLTLKALVFLSLILVNVMSMMSWLSGMNFTKSNAVVAKLFAVAGALVIFVGALSILTMMPLKETLIAIGLMSLVLGEMMGALALMALISKIPKAGVGMVAVAGSLLMLVTAINIMVVAIRALGELPTSTIEKGLFAIVAGLAALGVVSMLLSTAAPAMIAVAGAVTLLGISVLAAGTGIYMFALGLDLLMNTIITHGKGVVTALSDIAKTILDLLPYLGKKLVEFIGEIVLGLTELIISTAPAVAESVITLILAVLEIITTIIGPLARAIAVIIVELLNVLKDFVPSIVSALCELIIGVLRELIKFIPDFADVLVEFMMKLFESVINSLNSIDKELLVKGILAVGFIATLLITLSSLAAMVPAAIIGCIGAGIVIAILSGVLALIGQLAKIKGLKDAILNSEGILGALGTAIGSFIGGIVKGFSNEALKILPELGKNLSSFMTNLTPFIDGINKLEYDTLTKAGLLTGIIGLISGVSFIDAVNSFLTLGTSKVNNFANDLASIGEGIKKFNEVTKDISNFEHLEKAIAAGIGLATMASMIPKTLGVWDVLAGGEWIPHFKGFGKQIVKFAEEVNGADFTNVDEAIKVGTALGEMASAMPTTGGLWDLLAGGEYVPSFKKYGEQIAYFAESVNGMNFTNVDEAIKVGTALGEMAAGMPVTGGLWDLLAGTEAVCPLFGLYGGQIALFAQAVSAEGIDLTKAWEAIDLGTALGEMASAMPTTGGLWQKLTGENSIPDFSIFAERIASFANKISVIEDKNAIKNGTSAGIKIAEMFDKVYKSKGMTKVLDGELVSEDFGDNIYRFAIGLRTFSACCDTVIKENVSLGTFAGKNIATMFDKVYESDGLWKFVKGKNQAENFKNNMKKFAMGISTFSYYCSDIVNDNVALGTSAGKKIAAMFDKVYDSKGLWKFIGNKNKAKNFKNNIKDFVDGLSTFSSDASEIKNVESAIANVSKLTDNLSEFADSGIAGFINSFKDSAKDLSTAVDNMINSAIDKFTNSKDRFREAAEILMEEFVIGIESYKVESKEAFAAVINNTLSAIDSTSLYNEFYNAGSSVGEGFAAGIKVKSASASATALRMAGNVKSIVSQTLGINSPSKVFICFGEYCGEGLAIGLANYANYAYSAGSDLGDSAAYGLNNAVSKISKMIENDIDSQPVIRPVLDLSNIQAGAGAINGMLGMSPSVGVMSRVSSISSSMNKIQNGGNDDVISAIADLKHTMENATGDTYNINGITYDSGSEVQSAIETIVRATIRERRR